MDAVLELVGAPTFRSSFLCLKPTGTLVLVGNVTASTIPLPLGRMILQETKVVGSSGSTKEDLEEVFRMVQEGNLRPIVYREIPLSVEGVEEAHRLLQSKSVLGRVVLRCSL